MEHDRELVAAAVAADLVGSDASLAEDLVAACPDCAALAADLRAIAASTRALGSAFDGHVAPAPREFRLSEADADRLSSRVPQLGRMTISRLWGRRLGGALATIGLVGLLVSAVPFAFQSGAGGAASERAAQDLNTASANPAMLAPVASDLEIKAAPSLEQDSVAGQSGASVPSSATATPVILAGAALVAGLALLLATRGGRRAGP